MKSNSTTTTSNTPLNGADRGTSSARMGGRHLDILFSFLIMTVPMILFSALLLALVLHYRVIHNGFVSENLRFTEAQEDSSAIYVRLSATTLTTVASWSSTLAPILIGFAVALTSYPVARTLLRAARDNRPGQLPTPYQMALMLHMVASGGPGSLWPWLKYRVGWKGHRQSQPRAFGTMTSILFVGVVL